MGRREDVSQPGGRVAAVVVCAVDMWAVIVPSTYPQRSESTLRNRENNLTKFTEKSLHNLGGFHWQGCGAWSQSPIPANYPLTCTV